MRRSLWRECLSYAVYYAPRGRPRLLLLGEAIAQRYLEPTDHLIGVIGEPGTGKSSLIRGMFPGLELTNDDAGVNVRPPHRANASRWALPSADFSYRRPVRAGLTHDFRAGRRHPRGPP